MAPSTDELLSRDLEVLAEVLNRVVRRLEGGALVDLYEEMTGAARSGCLDAPDPAMAGRLVRLHATHLDLMNVAEDLQRVRVLRLRQRERYPEPLDESVAAALARLKIIGVGSAAMQGLLDRLQVELVLTAHPTQAKRRTVLSKLRRIADLLTNLETCDPLPGETARLRGRLESEVTLLWLTEPRRTAKPAVTDEVRTGLYTVDETLWSVLPEIQRTLDEALAVHYPGLRAPPGIVRFASWIGGDRDGNPYVTAAVTAETLRLHRGLAVERHRKELRSLGQALSLSTRLVPGLAAPPAAAPPAETAAAAHVRYLVDRYPDEPLRTLVAELITRLAEASEDDVVARLTGADRDDARVLRSSDLSEPLRAIDAQLGSLGMEGVSDSELKPVLDSLAIFGLHALRLDIRQLSRVHVRVLDELLSRLGLAEGYAEASGPEQAALLSRLLDAPAPDLGALSDLSTVAKETLALFRVLDRATAAYGPEAIGPYIISMTTGPQDVLAVLLLARWHGLCLDPAGGTERLTIAPLFETRADLRAAPGVMEVLFSHGHYRRHLEGLGRRQTVMVGYSDSNKDAGFVTANWELYQAQERLAAACRDADVELTFFHGRGGTVARGGGPTNRAIRAQPRDSVSAVIRITEQGEVIEERYGHRAIAQRHIEQVLHALLLTASPVCDEGCVVEEEWVEAMEDLSSAGYRAYRALVYEDPELLVYWQEATPVAEIGDLHMGSRPSRRSASAAFSEVRAIPWVFSWLQSRHHLPAFYGLGTALEAFVTGPARLALLRRMYAEWPFFRVLLDNVQLSLAKADMAMAREHASLVEDEALRDRVFGRIAAEHQRATRRVLEITGRAALLDGEPVLRESIRRRQPLLDSLNHLQVRLIERLRALPEPGPPEADELRQAIAGTILGIAAGLRNTG